MQPHEAAVRRHYAQCRDELTEASQDGHSFIARLAQPVDERGYRLRCDPIGRMQVLVEAVF